MKRMDKLADDWYESHPSLMESDRDDIPDLHIDAFKAGFRMARDMAKEIALGYPRPQQKRGMYQDIEYRVMKFVCPAMAEEIGRCGEDKIE